MIPGNVFLMPLGNTFFFLYELLVIKSLQHEIRQYTIVCTHITHTLHTHSTQIVHTLHTHYTVLSWHTLLLLHPLRKEKWGPSRLQEVPIQVQLSPDKYTLDRID